MNNIKLEELAQEVKALLGENYNVVSGVTPKNNTEVMFIGIRREGDTISSNMPVSAEALEDIPAEEIADAIVEHYFSLLNENLEVARDKIFYRMVSADNVAYLDGKIYEPYLDLVKVYYVLLDKEATVSVNETMLSNWGISKEELFAIGNKNMLNSKYEVIDMANSYIFDMLRENLIAELMQNGASREEAQFSVELMLGNANMEQNKMIIMRYENYISGASVILNKSALRKCHTLIGGDFIIIPSSTMEILAIPVDINATGEDILEMVEEVNATQLDVQEVLSNSVYKYNAETEDVTLVATRKVEEVA